jgi:hypothetical protein
MAAFRRRAPPAARGGLSARPGKEAATGGKHGLRGGIELSKIAAGKGGFALNGAAAYDSSGVSVAGAGDVNGDGLADLVVGAPRADPNGDYSGQSYVVFGKADGCPVELADVAAGRGGGFALNGIAEEDLSGLSVSGAGDVDGDGLDDVIVGAPYADPNGESSGQSYVVFSGDFLFA